MFYFGFRIKYLAYNFICENFCNEKRTRDPCNFIYADVRMNKITRVSLLSFYLRFLYIKITDSMVFHSKYPTIYYFLLFSWVIIYPSFDITDCFM